MLKETNDWLLLFFFLSKIKLAYNVTAASPKKKKNFTEIEIKEDPYPIELSPRMQI